VFELDVDLDESSQRIVSEVRTHGLLSSEAELASLLVGSRDDLIQTALEKMTKFKNEVLPKRPDGTLVFEAKGEENAINLEAQRRLLVLRRFRLMADIDQEGEHGQLSEACRLLQWAMADASFSSARLGQKIEEFQQFGTAIRASAAAQALLKKANLQQELWHWREQMRKERKDLRKSVDQMVLLEIMDQEHTKRFPGVPMDKEDVERIIQARNVLERQVRVGQRFRRQLRFTMAEAEAVLRRNLQTTGHRKLSLEEENRRFNPERTLTFGKNKGWW